MANYKLELVNGYLNQLLLHVDCVAKIGKSYLMKIISSHLKEKALQYYKSDPILQAALTGICVFNISGKTLYQLLYLPIWHKFYLLTTAILLSLQS